jgi:flagellar protein FlaF
MSLNAYQKAQNSVQSPRATEYRLFGQVTHALIQARDSGERDQAFMKALDWNRRMWSVFSSDCAVEGNGLPNQLRASIISLALFVSKHTSLVMRGQDDIETLIDINRTIMEGLAPLSKPQQPSAATPPTAPAGILRDV